ncbi:uncharacterized protein LAESUDRAFT_526638 [Laetiporus sulphureus 93-53]|uniref:Uncharacterized protein n=1 Tax=Laetiporus sulphureus 93-53 TaxID=1314785 RepID=A0A165BD86_9APHY|nr:uncharacterized protein LAESUDRAFT_526638 [Laetiporus sulphureus 93-53]KZT00787.1 hypothetical protein LAESUDRAFT_526638 [Laetiporus sulphureus 93-53]
MSESMKCAKMGSVGPCLRWPGGGHSVYWISSSSAKPHPCRQSRPRRPSNSPSLPPINVRRGCETISCAALRLTQKARPCAGFRSSIFPDDGAGQPLSGIMISFTRVSWTRSAIVCPGTSTRRAIDASQLRLFLQCNFSSDTQRSCNTIRC